MGKTDPADDRDIPWLRTFDDSGDIPLEIESQIDRGRRLAVPGMIRDAVARAAALEIPVDLDTPLIHSLVNPIYVTQTLLELGADPNAGGGKPLAWLSSVWDPDHARLLVEHGADVNIGGGVPLAYAIVCRNEEAVEFLIANGADPDAIEEDTLLMVLDCENQTRARLREMRRAAPAALESREDRGDLFDF